MNRPAELTEPGPSTPVVRARPERLRLWCALVAVVVAAACFIVAVLLPTSSDGTTFHPGDQVAVAGVGLLIAGAFWLPTRPRVIAERDRILVRSIVGPYKSIPWLVVRSVEFRPRWQWARIVLPADETVSLYAVQRLDGARSVTVMRALRELHAAAHDRADRDDRDDLIGPPPGNPAIGQPRTQPPVGELSAGDAVVGDDGPADQPPATGGRPGDSPGP